MKILYLVCFITTTLMPCVAHEMPKFGGTSIPVPPAQSQPWTPPQTKLPAVVVSAITELFNDGLADPRGCEYREIDVITGAWSGDSGGLRTHGWVVPAQGNEKFAVCWNGLVYPVISVGAPTDIHKDMAQLLETDRARIDAVHVQNEVQEKERKEILERSGQKYEHVAGPTRWNQNAISERTSAATDYMEPIKAALLLRLGETELAEKVWLQYWDAPSDDETKDPYLPLASSWSFTLFDRAISAHMRGDDHLALVSAQALIPIQQAVEAQAAKRSNSNNQDSKPYLTFLAQLPDLIADSQRRVAEPPQTPILQRADQSRGKERVIDLIHDLEFVDAQQMSFPGGVNLMDDANVQALVREGDGAVDSLLKCLVEDKRLTRSMQCGRPWFRQRDIIPVYQAAFVALSNILHATDFDSNSYEALRVPEGRKDLADKIRAYWQRTKGKPSEEIAYDVLNDDHADRKQWLQAASDIIMPSNITASPGSTRFGNGSATGGFTSRPTKPGEIISMRGESLRSKSNPSVSELLLKRLKAFQNDEQTQISPDTCNFALALADWDGKAYLNDLRAFNEIIKSHWTSDKNWQPLVAPLVSLYEKRIELGDAQGSADYANWIVNSMPALQELGWNRIKVLEPIWRYPDNPDMAKAADKIFTDPKSSWLPLVRFNDPVDLREFFQTPLFGVSSFRKELLRGLHDTRSIGTIILHPDGSLAGGWTGRGPIITTVDPLAPRAGSKVDYRFCDVYANEIAWLDGAPRCELYWPQTERDKAVAACIEFIQKYGDNFKWDPSFPSTNPLEKDDVHIHFARLDHPATPEDVQAGRAIFSLPGSPRIVKLLDLPLEASWTTLTDNVNSVGTVNGKQSIFYWTRGTIWQAEEVLINGEWQRFYGFTGRFHIAKVPASEIEFTSHRRLLVPHFEGILAGPTAEAPSGSMFPVFPSIKLGDPIPVTFKVRNISGTDQNLPAVLTPPTVDGKMFPVGLTLVLLHTDIIQQPEAFFRGAGDSIKWESVPLKNQTPPTSLQMPSRILGPDQEYSVSNLDLRNLFDLNHVGTYRFYVTVDPKDVPSQLFDSVIFTMVKSEN